MRRGGLHMPHCDHRVEEEPRHAVPQEVARPLLGGPTDGCIETQVRLRLLLLAPIPLLFAGLSIVFPKR